jgi:hypothetical protein
VTAVHRTHGLFLSSTEQGGIGIVVIVIGSCGGCGRLTLVV